MTVPFDNISEERIYSFITLDVLTLFIIVLVTAAAITTAATIDLLLAPPAFSKPYFFANIPVLLFISPVTSLSRSLKYSSCWIGMRWLRGDDIPRIADHSIRKIPLDIRASSMQIACTDRIPIGSSGWWRNCSNKNRKYRTNHLTSAATNRFSTTQQLGLPSLVVSE